MLQLTVPGRSCPLHPVGEVAHEVEEEVRVRHADDLVCNLDEETEAVRRVEVEALGDGAAQVAGSRGGVNLERLPERIKTSVFKNVFYGMKLKYLYFRYRIYSIL